MRRIIQTHLLALLFIAVSLSAFYALAAGVSQNNVVLADHCESQGKDKVELSVPVDGKDHVCGDAETGGTGYSNTLEENPIIVYLGWFIEFLTAGVGVVVTIMIVIGGVQYIMAGGDSQAVQAAKQKIFNAIIALVLFILMYAILSYLLPVDIF